MPCGMTSLGARSRTPSWARSTTGTWTPGTEVPRPATALSYVEAGSAGDEPADVVDYAVQNPSFPRDSTFNQFFNESLFESYRELGYHSLTSLLKYVTGRDGASPVRRLIPEVFEHLHGQLSRLSPAR